MTPKRKAKKLAPNNSNQGLIVIVFVSEVSITLMLSLSAMNDIVTEALNKIFSLLEHLKKSDDGKPSLIYTTRIVSSGLIQTYGKNLAEAFKKRHQIGVKSFKYMQEKTKGLSF